MAEDKDNRDLEQQLEQNLASFEGAGLDEEAKGIRARLDELRGSKSSKESKKSADEPKREPAQPSDSASRAKREKA